jgi:hypothetical protein
MPPAFMPFGATHFNTFGSRTTSLIGSLQLNARLLEAFSDFIILTNRLFSSDGLLLLFLLDAPF